MNYLFIENPGTDLAIKTVIDAQYSKALNMLRYLINLAIQHEHD